MIGKFMKEAVMVSEGSVGYETRNSRGMVMVLGIAVVYAPTDKISVAVGSTDDKL